MDNIKGFGTWLLGGRGKVTPQTFGNYSEGQLKDFQSIGDYLGSQVGQVYTPTTQERNLHSFYKNYTPWATQSVGEVYNPDFITNYYDQKYRDWDRTTKGNVAEQYAGNYWGSGRQKAVAESLGQLQGEEQGVLNRNEVSRQTALNQMLGLEPEMAFKGLELDRKFTDPLYNPVVEAGFNYLKPQSTSTSMDIQAPREGALGDILKWVARLYTSGAFSGGSNAANGLSTTGSYSPDMASQWSGVSSWQPY